MKKLLTKLLCLTFLFFVTISITKVGLFEKAGYGFTCIKNQAKSAWNNKLIRYGLYSAGGALAYAGLAGQGYVPGLKTALRRAWQTKELRVPKSTLDSIVKSVKTTKKVTQAMQTVNSNIASGLKRWNLGSLTDVARRAQISVLNHYDNMIRKYLQNCTEAVVAEREKVRYALKLLNVPDFFVKKMPIFLSPPHLSYENSTAFTEIIGKSGQYLSKRLNYPGGIGLNIRVLERLSNFDKMYVYLHEGGHIKTICAGQLELDYQLDEVTAEIYALAALVKKYGEKIYSYCNRSELSGAWPCLANYGNPWPYLANYEKIYHAKQLLDMLRRGKNINVFSYAKRIIAVREMVYYEPNAVKKAIELIAST